MEEKTKGMQAVINAQEGVIKELAAELRMLKRENLRMKLHMSVLIGSPGSKTAEDIRRKNHDKTHSLESLFHYN
jgi:hypothetical protein